MTSRTSKDNREEDTLLVHDAKAPVAADAASPSTSSVGGISPSRLRFYRLVTLLSLLLTDGTYTVLRRYSRGVLKETYSVNEVLLMAEFYKIFFSVFMMGGCSSGSIHDRGLVTVDPTVDVSPKERGSRGGGLIRHLFQLLLRSKKMLILSLIYGVMNVLSYYALARVGAGMFVVIANLKTLTTAGFSALILRRSFSWTKWRALVLLVVGVVLFILPTLKAVKDDTSIAYKDDRITSYSSGILLGIAAELVVVTLSGFASVYFERAIKGTPFNIWEWNFQLGFYSILMYCGLIFSEGDKTGAPFANWTPAAVCLSLLGAMGGLLVALSIKYGDSVLKTLAISRSIIYASVVDHIFLGGLFNEHMVLAAVIVVIAVVNYNFDASPNIDEGNQPLLNTMEAHTGNGSAHKG
ncbi:hypothetical protein ACHAXR_004747 [Thalassiosira sp. AJA248-18]